MPRTTIFITCLALLFLSSCQKEQYYRIQDNVMGKMPLYTALSDLKDIRSMPARPIVQTGTIFLQDTLFFVLEFKEGIHVFNFVDTANTEAVAFLKIPAITDFSVSGQRIYADTWRDLVTIDISDLQNIQEVNRATDVFDPILYPPLYNGYFECVDETKGAVIGWRDTTLIAPLCNTF
jgi:hypothetical protein